MWWIVALVAVCVWGAVMIVGATAGKGGGSSKELADLRRRVAALEARGGGDVEARLDRLEARVDRRELRDGAQDEWMARARELGLGESVAGRPAADGDGVTRA